MGSFSWLRADNLTKFSNIYYGCPFKFLIPKEFGGGFIKDHYQDYGCLGKKEDGTPKYDIYELLAFWNADQTHIIRQRLGRENKLLPLNNGNSIRSLLKFNGNVFPAMKEIDDFTGDNRIIGIDIGCDDLQVKTLKYPPKLVSASYKGTYEDCEGISLRDPDQGFYPVKRKVRQYEKL